MLNFCICDLYAYNTSKTKYLTAFCHLHIVNTLYVPRVLGKISPDILLSYRVERGNSVPFFRNGHVR